MKEYTYNAKVERSFIFLGEEDTPNFWKPHPVPCTFQYDEKADRVQFSWLGATPRPADVMYGLMMARIDWVIPIPYDIVINTLNATRVWEDNFGNRHACCGPKDWDEYHITESWYGKIGRMRGQWFTPGVLWALLSALVDE